MGLSVDFLAPSAASAELLDWLLDGKAAKGIGDAPVGAGGAALAASFLATAPSLPTAAKLPSSGMVSLAALFGDVGTTAPPAMFSSFDDMDAADLMPWPAVAAAPTLPPAVDAVGPHAAGRAPKSPLLAPATAPAAPRPPAAPPLPTPRTPRVAVSAKDATKLANGATAAALAGGPPPALPPLKRGKRKAVALDEIGDVCERRRQRRLAKNRATAAVSRERKHAQMQALTVTVYDLQRRNAGLVAALAARERELAAVRAGLPLVEPAAPRTAAAAPPARRSRRATGEALESIG